MTYILKELSANGIDLIKEDVAALRPYLTRHIKRFSDYIIDLDNVPNDIYEYFNTNKTRKSHVMDIYSSM